MSISLKKRLLQQSLHRQSLLEHHVSVFVAITIHICDIRSMLPVTSIVGLF